MIKNVTNGSITSYENSGLSENHTYYYQIRSYKLSNAIKIYGNYSSSVNCKAGKFKNSDFYYSVNENNKAEIDGYTGKSTTVIILEKIGGYEVGGINPYGLCPSETDVTGNTTMKNISLFSSLEWISSRAFMYCTMLEEVETPDGVEWIGSNSFYDCPSLKKIIILSSVNEIYGKIAVNCSDQLTYYVPANSYADSYLRKQGNKVINN